MDTEICELTGESFETCHCTDCEEAAAYDEQLFQDHWDYHFGDLYDCQAGMP